MKTLGKWMLRIGVLCMAICLLTKPYALSVSRETPIYLAIGDSISTGYGLTGEEDQPFVEILAKKCGYKLDNEAKNGETSSSLCKRIRSSKLQTAIERADIVTITIGGNDMMNALYLYLVSEYNETVADTTITVEEMREQLMEGDWKTLLFAVRNISGFPTSEEALEAVAEFRSHLGKIIDEIRRENTDVEIYVATQYHPYLWLKTGNSWLDRQIEQITRTVDAGVGLLNQAILDGDGYQTVDVYAAFVKSEKTLTNAAVQYVPPLSFKGNLDFHPNGKGHQKIADAFWKEWSKNFNYG